MKNTESTGPNTVTTKVIKQRVYDKHGDSIKLIEEFKGWKTSIKFKCTKCDHIWKTRPQAVTNSGTRCPVCVKKIRAENIAKGHSDSKVKRKKFEERVLKTENLFDLTFLSTKIPNSKDDYIRFQCNICKETFGKRMSWVSRCTKGCPYCAEERRLENSMTPEAIQQRKLGSIKSTEEAREIILNYTNGFTKLVSKWNGAKSPRKLKCLECGYKWNISDNSDGIKTGTTCKKCFPENTSRKFSKIAIRWLRLEEKKRKIKIQHALNGGEYRIPDTNYYVDGYCEETNTVFEFHGDRYHGNPEVFKDTDRPNPFSNETAKHLYRKTKKKERIIKEAGYNLVVMWEHDFIKYLYSRNLMPHNHSRVPEKLLKYRKSQRRKNREFYENSKWSDAFVDTEV